MKTVIDAVNEFKGDYNCKDVSDTCDQIIVAMKNFYGYSVGDIEVGSGNRYDGRGPWRAICTIKEFLATVAECETNFGKCKQSYSDYKFDYHLHPALKRNKPTKELAMDIDWSKAPEGATHHVAYLKDGSMNEFVEYIKTEKSGEAYYSMTDGGHWSTYVEKDDNFTLTPRPQPTPVFTQEMADNGVQVEAGMRFATEAGEYIAEYTNKKSVVFTDENGFLVTVTRGHAKPIDIRTDTEKAIDSLDDFNLCMCNGWQEDVIGFIKSGEFHGVKWVGE